MIKYIILWPETVRFHNFWTLLNFININSNVVISKFK